MNIQGEHKCPVCGTQGTFTITDLDEAICDTCQVPFSVGTPVKEMRENLIAMQAFEEEGGAFIPITRADPDAFQESIEISETLLAMLKENIMILRDNSLLVGDNLDETMDLVDHLEQQIVSLKSKFV